MDKRKVSKLWHVLAAALLGLQAGVLFMKGEHMLAAVLLLVGAVLALAVGFLGRYRG